jgi:formate transporter
MTQDNSRTPLDAYAPAQIALLVEQGGVAKVRLSAVQTATLGALAGAFIAFGAMFYTLTITGADLGFGPARLLGGVAFSLGLILVLVGGAELFTGNNLIVMAWAERKVTSRQLLRNWGLVYVANFVGALGAVALFYLAGALDLSGGAVGQTAARIAEAKLNLDFSTAFFRGILCNALVCLAVWLSFAARDVAGKILAIIFPISAFVALGFEHSVANMFLIPIGMLANGGGIDMVPVLRNLLPVTLGNIVGGSGFVALTYWLVYLRKPAVGDR